MLATIDQRNWTPLMSRADQIVQGIDLIAKAATCFDPNGRRVFAASASGTKMIGLDWIGLG